VSVVSVATAIILQLPGKTADAAVLGVSVDGQSVVPNTIQTVNSFLYGSGYGTGGAAANAPSPDQAYAPQPQPTNTSSTSQDQDQTSTPPVVASSNDSTAPSANNSSTLLLPGEDLSASTSASLILPYSVGTFGNHFAPGDGWVSWWGAPNDSSGTLDLLANATSTGAGALLPASRDWLNYTFTANIDWVSGQTFGLVGRYVDSNNYVLCDFSTSPSGVLMTLRQYVNGTSTDLATGDVYNAAGVGEYDRNVALQVQDGRGACAFDGHEISSLMAGTSIAASSTPGGIGFTEWDPTEGASDVVVRTIGVAKGSYELGQFDDQTTLY